MATYPFTQAKRDYGPRKGTLGIDIHMTEGNGGDGDLRYLALDPSNRGVSANFFAHRDGTVHRMLAWDHAAGTLNPRDRAAEDKGYYGAKHLKAVLGTHWTDPNAYVLSIEIGGKRADGPNQEQVDAVIAWGLDMRKRYPELVGSFGHADQTDTKGCPGTSSAIKAIFAGIGGHGLFKTEVPDVQSFTMLPGPIGSLVVKDAGASYLRLKTNTTHSIKVGTARERAIPVRLLEPIIAGKPKTDAWMLGYLVGNEAAFLLARNVEFTPDPTGEDCAPLIAAAVATARDGARIADPTIVYP